MLTLVVKALKALHQTNMELINLVRVPVAIFRKDREKDNPQIEGKAPVLEVEQVVFHPLADRRVSAPAVDLRPPSDANLEAVTIVVPGYLMKELLHEANQLRPRPNNAHIAFQHIEKLGELVKTRFSEEDSNASAARVIWLRMQPIALRRITDSHSSKLVHAKDLSVQPHAILTEQNGPRRAEPHGDRNHGHQWRRQHESKDGENDVESTLQQGISDGFCRGRCYVKDLKAAKLEHSFLDGHVVA